MLRPRPDLHPAQRAVLVGWLRAASRTRRSCASACATAADELEQGAAPGIDPDWLPKDWRFMLRTDAQEALW